MEWHIRDIEGSFAAEVEGLALEERLDEATIEALREALDHHGLVIFRRRFLTEEELLAFATRFGEPDRIVRDDWASRHRPEITYITNLLGADGRPLGGLGSGEIDWHSDQSYMPAPATGSFLYGVEIPPNGTPTYFANLYLAFEALSEARRNRLEGLYVVYSYAKRVATYEGEQPSAAEIAEMAPEVRHPLVHTHPKTGRKALYLDPTTAVAVEGLEAAESAALLAELAAHAVAPGFVHAHDWRMGDLVVWDNAVMLHRREPFDPTHNRLLKRATVRMPPERHIQPVGSYV